MKKGIVFLSAIVFTLGLFGTTIPALAAAKQYTVAFLLK
jgi:hypothetical protein